MRQINIEIKARCLAQDKIRDILKSKNADYKGTDYQIDVYFKINNGRLKLRKGNIENYLVYYNREDKAGPKQSNVILYETDPKSPIEDILTESLGVLAIVDKNREIYFIDNVKFHLDNVKNLGYFVEIEAIDYDGKIGKKKLYEQCKFYMNLFGIKDDDLINCSYSDLLLRK